MKFLGVSGVYDNAGLIVARASLTVILPSAVFEAQYPAHLYPCLRFAERLARLVQNSGRAGR